MRLLFKFSCIALIVAASSHTLASESKPTFAETCPGVVQWYKSHEPYSEISIKAKDETLSFEEPGLREKLIKFVEEDQALRRQYLAATSNVQAASREVHKIDQANTAWLKAVINETGFPTVKQVGHYGVHMAWLLAQHADLSPDLQERVLKILQSRIETKEVEPDDLARLTDRVMRSKHLPEVYGTQYNEKQWLTAKNLVDGYESLREIDIRRAQLGLMPLNDYLCARNFTYRNSRRVFEDN